jgi:protein phosphatase
MADLELYLESDVGLVRSRNEDFAGAGHVTVRDGSRSVSLQLPRGPYLFGVADGVGGGNAGDVASRMVFNRLASAVAQLEAGLSEEQLRERVKAEAKDAHDELIRQGMLHPKRAGMGTTCTAVLLYESRPYLVHAGDSRLYRLRGGALRQLSRDHTLREFSGNPSIPGNIIANCYGVEGDFFTDFHGLGDELEEGAVYLCCSDGLSDSLGEEEIGDILDGNGELASRGAQLVARAREAGGHDNITLVLARRR